jgi:antitoxin component of MazEF toxin-antitoxin module
MEIRKLQLHGNSVCINIPKRFILALGLHPGSLVQASLNEKKQIVIENLKPTERIFNP